MAVTETIQELLQGIDDAQYGRDMREFIRKAIQKCYEEGSAGETDLVARMRLDTLEDDLADIHKWYKIPCDPVTNIANITVNAHAIINPTLKLLDLTVTAYSTAGVSQYEAPIVKNLPIIKCFENTKHSSRRFSLSGYKGVMTNLQSTTEFANLMACTDTLDVGDVTYTQSVVIYELPGIETGIDEMTGHILVPYTSLSDAHPMSEAVLIEDE